MLVRFGKDANQRLPTFRYIVEAGLAADAVEAAIEAVLEPSSLRDGLNKGRLDFSGMGLFYHAFKFADGTVNVGRITIESSPTQLGAPITSAT